MPLPASTGATMGQIEIKLGQSANGFGFIQGEARNGDTVVHVDLLPPEHLWAGCIMLDEHRPDPTLWQVFADGELIAKIERQEDVAAALLPLLANR